LQPHTGGYGRVWLAILTASVVLLAAVLAPVALAEDSGGAGPVAPLDPTLPAPSGGSGGTSVGAIPPAPIPGAVAKISADGRTAIPPAAAPEPVKQAILAANRITHKPYRYGGGHRSFRSSGYDCSGSVSYALHGGGLLDSPLDSRAFRRWGDAGRGQWITVYTNPGHAFVVIAGLRFDTSGPGESGPRWRSGARSSRGYAARHPQGF
jgi:cell wall-associated NlpC family hydrolase